jgi:CRISPR-associated protein Cas2
MLDRLNQYKIMWVFVFWDLPNETPSEKKIAHAFRKKIITDGFTMLQFSMYMRHCASRENADVHIARVKNALPPTGHIVIFAITDKQFGDMQVFYGRKPTKPKQGPQQLELW